MLPRPVARVAGVSLGYRSLYGQDPVKGQLEASQGLQVRHTGEESAANRSLFEGTRATARGSR